LKTYTAIGKEKRPAEVDALLSFAGIDVERRKRQECPFLRQNPLHVEDLDIYAAKPDIRF
jgi:hypothetical protein